MYIAHHLPRAYLASVGEEDKEFQVFALEIESLSPSDPLTVSSERLAQLQNATEQDTVLQTLKTTVFVGWPEQKSQVPSPIREYWSCSHFCDITVKKFRSLHSIFTRLQYRWKHIHLLFMILLAISLVIYDSQILNTKIHDSYQFYSSDRFHPRICRSILRSCFGSTPVP